MSLNTNTTFENAHKAFLDTLSVLDRDKFSACSSSDDLIRALKELKCLSQHGQKRSLTRCLSVFKKLNDRLQVYFDALNVLASAETHAAIAYGAFRVVIQLAAAFPAFLEKLLAIIERLADTFPQYDAIIDIYAGSLPARMYCHLESVYRDLFDFLQMTARIFTASNGKVKRPMSMIAAVIWKPFDVRFDELLKRMDDHRKFIMDELAIYQLQKSNDTQRAAAVEKARLELEREKLERDRDRARKQADMTEHTKGALDKEIRNSSTRSVLEWLSPPLFADALESSQDQRTEGTAKWIFGHEAFKEWRASKPQPQEGVKWKQMPPWFLWVHGNPGCGKTTLASSVVEEVTHVDINDNLTRTCYFFFKYGDPINSTIEAAFRSALAQILHRCHDMDGVLDKFLFASLDHASASGQRMATSKELMDLIRACANELHELVFVLDGIDESNDPESVGRKLKELVTTAPIKVICLSRPNVNILSKMVRQPQRVEFQKRTTNADIRIFLLHQLNAFVEEGMLASTANTERLADTLVYGADGMFLWARLMVRYLSSPALSPAARLRTINSVHYPEGLNAMYDRIFSLIAKSSKPEMELACRILLWLKYSTSGVQGLSHDILRSAIGDETEQDDFADFTSVAVSVCGGLVEFTQQRFQFTHLTVTEYLDNQPWSRIGLTLPIALDERSGAIEITRQCLQYLLKSSPSCAPIKSSRLGVQKPISLPQVSFEAYVVMNWSKHLLGTISGHSSPGGHGALTTQSADRLLNEITRFLDNPLSVGFWIERFYSLSSVSASILNPMIDIETWSRGAACSGFKYCSSMQETAERLLKLSAELRTLDTEWDLKLHRTPCLIWDDVLAFQKGGVLAKIAEASGTRPITTLAPSFPRERDKDARSSHCLCTISTTSKDGLSVGVLCIYPSRQFERFWKSTNTAVAYSGAEEFCSHWIAKYEVWSSQTSTRLAGLEIPLPESEIRLVLRQSFRQDQSMQTVNSDKAEESFETSFPIAIGHDCLKFSVLRTVYDIKPAKSGTTSVCSSFVLPLDSLKHFDSKWTPQLRVFSLDHLSFLPELFRLRWRDWYTYSISFSPDGKYISFADYQKPCMTHLAVFEVIREPQPSARLVRWTMVRLGTPRTKEMTFHPQRPCVAFLSENKVWFWEFLNRNSNPVHLPTRFDAPGYIISELGEVSDSTKIVAALSFSLCGTYLLARNQNDVDVLRVPRDTQRRSHDKQAGHAICPQVGEELQSLTSPNSLLELQKTGFSPNCVISDAQIVSGSKNTGPVNTLFLSGSENKITIGATSTEDRLELLSLPESFDMRHTSISLKIPVSSDGQFRLMLNKRAAEAYGLGREQEQQFPVIVERGLTSIVHLIDDPTALPYKRIKLGNPSPK